MLIFLDFNLYVVLFSLALSYFKLYQLFEIVVYDKIRRITFALIPAIVAIPILAHIAMHFNLAGIIIISLIVCFYSLNQIIKYDGQHPYRTI